ncbi:MAG: hypothetical protein Q7J27_02005, partial [Syntrophales bacterium]|nr:hypothetical protein [Syntrophales bacterium]
KNLLHTNPFVVGQPKPPHLKGYSEACTPMLDKSFNRIFNFVTIALIAVLVVDKAVSATVTDAKSDIVAACETAVPP